jgi:signal transduction histidine kinase
VALRARRLKAGGPPAAAAFTLALVAVALVGGMLVQRAADERNDLGDRRRGESGAGRLQAALDVLRATTRELAAVGSDSDEAFQSAAGRAIADDTVPTVALANAEGSEFRSYLATGRPLRLPDGLPALTTLATEARLATDVRVAAPVIVDGQALVVAMAPVYPSGTPVSVLARRGAARDLAVVVTSFERLLQPPGTTPIWATSEVEVRTPQGRIGQRPDRVVHSTAIDVGSTTWAVVVGPRQRERPIAGLLVVVVGLIAAGVTYALLARQHQQRRRAEAAAAHRADQLEMIATTSTSLHQSLELADLLPTFCVRIAEEFRLDTVSVLVTDDDGQLQELFRVGEPAGAPVIELELRRGWRAVGRLVAWGPPGLDPVASQSLQSLADLLAVAISNAQLYQREQQAVTRLSELDAMKNAFLGTVSHELRTAATAVQGFGELLTEHWATLPEERRFELAVRLRRQAGSLRHLVDDLLDYARLEHQSLQVHPRELSLTSLVQQLVDSMSPLVAGHEVRIEADPDVTAWADPIAVERIVANLLSNAGKYSPEGTTVTVRVTHEGTRARVEVVDQGPGIPLEERGRVFVRFYRVSNAETLKTRGAGIGLSILHDFAERSGATVTIDDAPGGGARVIVDFPTEPVPELTLEGADR